jgi:hypothetical protein
VNRPRSAARLDRRGDCRQIAGHSRRADAIGEPAARDREQQPMSDTTRKSGRINWAHLVTVGSAAVIVGTMILVLGFATGWALAGMFGLGEVGTLVLEAIFIVIAAAGAVTFWRLAVKAEPIFDR